MAVFRMAGLPVSLLAVSQVFRMAGLPVFLLAVSQVFRMAGLPVFLLAVSSVFRALPDLLAIRAASVARRVGSKPGQAAAPSALSSLVARGLW